MLAAKIRPAGAAMAVEVVGGLGAAMAAADSVLAAAAAGEAPAAVEAVGEALAAVEAMVAMVEGLAALAARAEGLAELVEGPAAMVPAAVMAVTADTAVLKAAATAEQSPRSCRRHSRRNCRGSYSYRTHYRPRTGRRWRSNL